MSYGRKAMHNELHEPVPGAQHVTIVREKLRSVAGIPDLLLIATVENQ